MSEAQRKCYRDRNNGVYYGRNEHRHDCTDPECRGCVACPNTHCTATKNCAWHTPEGEPTCGRCLATARQDLRWIGTLEPLMLPAAIAVGINSEAANLAGPGSDYKTFSARRTIDKHWIQIHIPDGHQMRAMANLIPDDDEHHPHVVLTRWATMIAAEYHHEMPDRLTSVTAGAYLDRNLHRIAQDDTQDFALLARELRKCRQHLESVLHNDDRPDRGAPCPECVAVQQEIRADLVAREVPEDEWPKLKAPRLARQYAHWCDDEDCERTHHDNDSQDTWQCPKVPTHQWTHDAYTRYVEDRRTA